MDINNKDKKNGTMFKCFSLILKNIYYKLSLSQELNND